MDTDRKVNGLQRKVDGHLQPTWIQSLYYWGAQAAFHFHFQPLVLLLCDTTHIWTVQFPLWEARPLNISEKVKTGFLFFGLNVNHSLCELIKKRKSFVKYSRIIWHKCNDHLGKSVKLIRMHEQINHLLPSFLFKTCRPITTVIWNNITVVLFYKHVCQIGIEIKRIGCKGTTVPTFQGMNKTIMTNIVP